MTARKDGQHALVAQMVRAVSGRSRLACRLPVRVRSRERKKCGRILRKSNGLKLRTTTCKVKASERKIDMLIYVLFFIFPALFAIVSVLYMIKISEYRNVYRECNVKDEIIIDYREKVKSLEKQLNGDREPSANCIGCKYLNIVDANPITTKRTYSCQKNLRCKEYEERIDGFSK